MRLLNGFDDSLQPKLIYALCSLCILVSAFFAAMFSHDLFQEPPYGWGINLEMAFLYSSLSLADHTVVAGLFAIPLALWHVSDFVEKSQYKSKLGAFLTSYPIVLYLAAAGLTGYAVIASGYTQQFACPKPEVASADSAHNFFFFCSPPVDYMIEYLVLPFLAMLALLSLGKTLFAALTRLKPN